MTEGEQSKQAGNRSQMWKKAGKILFLLGFVLIVSNVILSLFVGFAGAYSGSTLYILYNQYAYPVAIIGGFLIILGILTYLWSEGIHEQLAWSMKTGPYIK